MLCSSFQAPKYKELIDCLLKCACEHCFVCHFLCPHSRGASRSSLHLEHVGSTPWGGMGQGCELLEHSWHPQSCSWEFWNVSIKCRSSQKALYVSGAAPSCFRTFFCSSKAPGNEFLHTPGVVPVKLCSQETFISAVARIVFQLL